MEITAIQLEEIYNQVMLKVEMGFSNDRISMEYGISKTTVSNIRNKYWDRMSNDFREKLFRKIKISNWKIRETDNFATIQGLCDRADNEKKMFAISAYTGAGKTVALKYYAKKRHAYYFKVSKFGTTKDILTGIMREIGYIRAGGLNQMIRIVSRKLKEEGGVLILDDVHKLKNPGFDLIYELYEQFEGKVGIILAGTEHFKMKLERRCATDTEGFRELTRRIAYWESLYPVSKETVMALCEEYGIKDKNAQRFIVKRAVNYFVLEQLICSAVSIAQQNKQEVTREILADLQIANFEYA